jgi:hypothetical protein
MTVVSERGRETNIRALSTEASVVEAAEELPRTEWLPRTT